MLTKRIIPCLDTKDGQVVKGVRFANLRSLGDPAALARAYEEQGADELVILDVSATPEGRRTAYDTISKVRDVLSIPLTVGGGIRESADVVRLLECGADKVSVNTAAVTNPELISHIAQTFGCQCTVLALDAARMLHSSANSSSPENTPPRWEVVTHSGAKRTGLDVIEWARQAQELGAGEILLTSWDKDGTRSGYDLELLTAVSTAVRIPVIASGGAATPTHLAEAFSAGADAVLAASIFHDGDYTVLDVKQYLQSVGVSVRI